jgi:hypothetical protein
MIDISRIRFRSARTAGPGAQYNTYELHAALAGMDGSAACISIHPLETHVACGGEGYSRYYFLATHQSLPGDKGTCIWNLMTSEMVTVPAGAGSRGATTALVWVTRQDDREEALVFRTTGGYLVIWRKETGNKVSIVHFFSC